MAVGSSQLPWAQHQLAANLGPVKGLVGLVSDGVFSRDVRSLFIPPTPKPDIAVPNAGPPLGAGGADAPTGNIDRPRMGGKNGRLKASGIDVAAPNVSRPLKRRKCSLPRRNPPTPARCRPARARPPPSRLPQAAVLTTTRDDQLAQSKLVGKPLAALDQSLGQW